jgi:hypothetical protein
MMTKGDRTTLPAAVSGFSAGPGPHLLGRTVQKIRRPLMT